MVPSWGMVESGCGRLDFSGGCNFRAQYKAGDIAVNHSELLDDVCAAGSRLQQPTGSYFLAPSTRVSKADPQSHFQRLEIGRPWTQRASFSQTESHSQRQKTKRCTVGHFTRCLLACLLDCLLACLLSSYQKLSLVSLAASSEIKDKPFLPVALPRLTAAAG